MRRGSNTVRWLQICFKQCLLVLIALAFLQAPPVTAPAAASTSAVVRATADAAVAKKKKKKKKKRKKRKKRKKKKKKKKKPPPKKSAAKPAAVISFEGDGGGMAMAGQVRLGITSVPHADADQMEIALAPEPERFAKPSVLAAMAATKSGSLVRGVGKRFADHVKVKVLVYAKDGQVHFYQLYQTPPGEMDPLALAPQIGDELDAVLPKLATMPVVTNASTAFAEEAKPEPTEETTTTTTDSKPDEEKKKDEPEEESTTPLFNIGAGVNILYWSYELKSEALNSTVKWNPLDVYPGAALGIGVWPVEWVGADLKLGFGMHSYTDSLAVDQDKIDITALDVALLLNGRYLFDFGVGVGGHIGYRYAGSFVSEQTPVNQAPGFAAHMVSPGIDIYATALAPYLTLRLAGDVIPWGMYSESPDQPGESASMWGWNVTGSVRSTFFMGIYAELSGFYQLTYITYTGKGDRGNSDGKAVSDATITNGLRGFSIGVGWSY